MALPKFAQTLLAKILAVSFQKGGVTKSTQAFSIAHRSAELGRRTILIDFDEGDLAVLFPPAEPGHNYIMASHLLTGELDGRELRQVADNLFFIEADVEILDVDLMDIDHVVNRMQQSLQQLARGIDLIVIDTPPNLQSRMLAAMAAAHAVVSPINIGPFTFRRLEMFADAFLNVQERYNPMLRHLGWLPCNINSKSPDQVEALTELKAEHGEQVFEEVIMSRACVVTSLARQQPVWRSARSGNQRAAAKEQLAACDAVLSRLDRVE
ncbi:ParA family protein [Chromobacterium vaccinii]|uniref:ParA family protein n=1 Tax=Chromobacterium vaccinii TaxID=1108595 RepID=UPI00345A42B9